MSRTLEIVVILFLSLFSFFLGVKYSKTIKEHASWMFENKGDEVELPDLSNTENPEMDAPVDENGKPIDQTTPPAEDQNIVPSIDDTDNAVAPASEAVPAAAPAAAAPANNNVAQPAATQAEPAKSVEQKKPIHKKKKKKAQQQQ